MIMNAQTDINRERANISALADGELGSGDAARVLDAMDASAARGKVSSMQAS